jgi:putative restriction endonuclease
VDAETRAVLRRLLVETYFAEEIHDALYEIGRVNHDAFQYSQYLFDRIQTREGAEPPEVDEPVRAKGFRKAIVQAYDHRCAITGLRIRTPDGRSAVDAAHIVPWSHSQNDDLRNGLALSKLSHWVFEHGLLTITKDLTVQLSDALDTDYNAVGAFSTLDGRSLLLPERRELHPATEYLTWHRKNIFLG